MGLLCMYDCSAVDQLSGRSMHFQFGLLSSHSVFTENKGTSEWPSDATESLPTSNWQLETLRFLDYGAPNPLASMAQVIVVWEEI